MGGDLSIAVICITVVWQKYYSFETYTHRLLHNRKNIMANVFINIEYIKVRYIMLLELHPSIGFKYLTAVPCFAHAICI